MIEQVGALPYRLTGSAQAVEVLLVTSRDTGRWVVPKGHLMIGKAAYEAAAIEAEEEAGVRGIVAPVPLGHFAYIKRTLGSIDVEMRVELFALDVRETLERWKEMDQRQRRWFTAAEAAVTVDEADLGELIHRFGHGLGPRPVEAGSA